MKLLTPSHANAKTAKNATQGGFLSYILHLAPSNVSGYNTCPKASKGCRLTCLNTAGRGRFDSVQSARIRKTRLFFEDRSEFIKLLVKDLDAVVRKANKTGLKAVVRLNGTSDIDFIPIVVNDLGHNVFDAYPTIQFYDYTALVERLRRPIRPNYHLTFSHKETNLKDVDAALLLGFNVAVVYDAALYVDAVKRGAIDGDAHDLRFLDGDGGRIVALKAKGRAKRDTTGFVVRRTVSDV
jgi:hypothetical protein